MTDDLEETLRKLGLAVGLKSGRPLNQINTIVWKTTRTVGMCDAPLETSGRFIILRRHPYNVFESQFRVGFGEKNRNPLRFAIFRESYECAFRSIPKPRRIDIEYDDLPEAMSEILHFIGIDENEKWKDGFSSLEAVAKNRPWLSQITKNFSNTDVEKRNRLSSMNKIILDISITMTRMLRPVISPLRGHFDNASLKTIISRADSISDE